ncbi:hypothetical protein B4U45_15120 [Mycobacterium persicum]|uniref:Uncharacterized protein n=1 Tax=Mycobacterium persicum TaxID=1487726 RepID=A0A1X0L9T0_9MYCO|nr:hypothetical protein A4G31_14360 [Mycobacterium persicum]ORC07729.1 hypothetical protein B4U45_15120 [Mycobacterium persicum]VAZ70566.1 hypothetical protein LAUMK15_00370 [Mycobacterium persicum]VAZ81428.1 hypothetical protein LAUMK42_00229 [Mycobacterium persicum]VAZ86779.1 hypothetical protein LAUMK4_00020 [Mycobacterium persicum]
MARDSLKAVAEGFDAAGKACSDYAQAIDDAHSKILHEMAVLGATVAVTEVVAAVLIPFTATISEGVEGRRCRTFDGHRSTDRDDHSRVSGSGRSL